MYEAGTLLRNGIETRGRENVKPRNFLCDVTLQHNAVIYNTIRLYV